MSVETTHGVHQPTGSPAPDLSWGDLLPIDYLQLTGGSISIAIAIAIYVGGGGTGNNFNRVHD